MCIASVLTVMDLWKVYLTGVQVKGRVVEYVPEIRHRKIEHNYLIDTDYGRILKRLSHEKVDIGSDIVFIVPDESSFFDDYDMSKEDSFIEFIFQDGWWIAIIGLFLFGAMFAVSGIVHIKTETGQKL